MKVPKGWYRIRTGCKVYEGDRWWIPSSNVWVKVASDWSYPAEHNETIIRRRKKVKP